MLHLPLGGRPRECCAAGVWPSLPLPLHADVVPGLPRGEQPPHLPPVQDALAFASRVHSSPPQPLGNDLAPTEKWGRESVDRRIGSSHVNGGASSHDYAAEAGGALWL
mmetsp:Transcript_112110/g.282213  ORF Transcript_112110/g.282213 Transcript_112110/m.282213 type:complete len:108 (-) Transcript_112110:220-543(-)